MIDDSFLLNLFPMFYIIGDFGPKVNLRIEIWALTSCMACGQYLPMYERARYRDHGLMDGTYIIPNNLRIDIRVLFEW